MKAVLISIQPKWCELIASGKKTVEVRKTAPKEVPFKAYIYATKPKARTHPARIYNSYIMPESGKCGSGKVIGEFVCDKVEECIPDYNPVTQEFFYNEWEDSKATCLTVEEEAKYGKSKPLYGWHISDLKVYDEPRELSEFRQACKIFSKKVCGSRTLCGEQKGICDGTKKLTRPPQSWQYVEEV